MKTILHKLYGGEINPYENMAPTCRAFYEVNEKIQREKRYFTGRMPPDDRQRFEALENLYCDASEMEVQEAFCRGFKLGAQMLMEVFAPPPERPLVCRDEPTE